MADFEGIQRGARTPVRNTRRGRVSQRSVLPNAISRKHRQLVQEGIDAIVSPRSEASEGDFVDIQEAIDYVDSLGGGTVLIKPGTYELNNDINIKSDIEVLGASKSRTTLDFLGTSFGVRMVGSSSANKVVDTRLQNLTIENSNAAGGLTLSWVDGFFLKNLEISSCKQAGVLFANVGSNGPASKGFVENVSSKDNDAEALKIDGDPTDVTFSNCVFESPSGNNVVGFSSSSESQNVVFINCFASGGDVGFSFSGSSYSDIRLVACLSESNGTGYKIADAVGRVIFIGCYGDDNNTDWDIAGYATLIGCDFGSGFDDSVTVQDNPGSQSRVVLIGNIQSNATSFNTIYNLGEASIQSIGNIDQRAIDEREIMYMKNTSGGSIDSGDVVVFKSVAAGDEITTTTTGGDDKVFGMVLHPSSGASDVDNDDYCHVLIRGKTNALKVDGTTDIAIGDFLSTFTSAGIAQKASSGDMVFAIALEAYTTDDSNGVIDALLITPRKI